MNFVGLIAVALIAGICIGVAGAVLVDVVSNWLAEKK